MRKLERRLAYSAAAILLIILGSCAKNPVTGRRQLALISTSQEIALGKQSHPEILAEFGRVDNQALQEYFSRIGLEIAEISDRPDLPWTFTILDSPVVNAFAVPGGYIYLTRGILAYMNNEAEMAGVLGHEITHVTARHSVTQISQQQLLGMGLGLGSMFSSTFDKFSGLAETGVGILMLKYSRDHERQSDRVGLQYMAKAGYEPSELSRFFEVFENLGKESGGTIPDWLSSHPAPPDRIRYTASEAETIKNKNPGRRYKVNRDAFLSHIEGIVYGHNPREGFVEGNHFYHPDLRFQIDFPGNWKVQNTKQSVTFTEPDGKAAMELKLVPPEFGDDPEAAADAVARRPEVFLLEGAPLRIHGNPAYLGLYRLQDNTSSINILAGFIAYEGNLYQLAGMAPASYYETYAATFDGAIRNFRALRDTRILSTKPDRIKIHRARRGETLSGIWGSMHAPAVSLQDLSLLNRLDPNQALDAGTAVKVIDPGNNPTQRNSRSTQ